MNAAARRRAGARPGPAGRALVCARAHLRACGVAGAAAGEVLAPVVGHRAGVQRGGEHRGRPCGRWSPATTRGWRSSSSTTAPPTAPPTSSSGSGLPGVRVIRQANAGKPAALNTGIRHARGRPAGAGRRRHRLPAGHRPPPGAGASPTRAVGAVSGNTKVANRRGLLGRWQHLEYVIGFNLDRRLFDVLACMPTVPGAIGAFRREVLADVGGVSDGHPRRGHRPDDGGAAAPAGGWSTRSGPSPGPRRRPRCASCGGSATAGATARCRRCGSTAGGASSAGRPGKLGRRGLPYLLLFQVAAAARRARRRRLRRSTACSSCPGRSWRWRGCGCSPSRSSPPAYALRLDRERYGPLWSLPLQQFVYRQLMYLVVVQSVVTALLGSRLRWHRMVRTGAAAALVGAGQSNDR